MTAHRSRITDLPDGRATWACTCGQGSKRPASSHVKASAAQSAHVQTARDAEAREGRES